MPRFLVDEDLPHLLASLLLEKRHESEYVRDLNLRVLRTAAYTRPPNKDKLSWSRAIQRQSASTSPQQAFWHRRHSVSVGDANPGAGRTNRPWDTGCS